MVKRFWKYVDKTPGHGPTGDCWLWTGYKLQNGYSMIGRGPKSSGQEYVHRVSFMIHVGRMPAKGLYVCHKCDVRSCVNPAHLFEGTPQENNQDMAAKGRCIYHKGEAHYRAKLAESDVRQIRTSDLSAKVAADRFAVSLTTIYAIRRLELWRHVS